MGELGVGLSAFLVGLWLLNTAPVFNLPLAPELLAVALGCLLISRTSTRFEASSRLLKTAYVLFGGHLVILIVRAALAAKGFGTTCGMMLGTAQKVECLFQAGVDQNSAVRTLGYDLAAAALFVGAFFYSRTAKAHRIPLVIALVGTAFAVVSLVAKALGAKALFPAYVLTMQWDAAFGTYLMENPTWIWPYLFPAMACLFWLFATNKKPLPRLLAVVALLAIAWVCLAAQRRGGTVLVVVVVAFTLTIMLDRPLARWTGRSERKKAGAIFVVFATLVVALAGVLFLLGKNHADGGLAARFATTSIVDVARENIWSTAAEGIRAAPWVGHGFASWHNEFFKLADGRDHVPVLDTAHNYFVQSLFELGAPQLFLALAAFACFALASLRAPHGKREQARLLALAAIGYLLIASVQEFNFVRSTYYTHALFAGWLLGSGRLVPGRDKRATKILRSAALVAAVVAVASLWTSSLVGYQYEAPARFGFQPKVRWLKTFGTMTFVKRPKSGQGERFAVYTVAKTFTSAYELSELSGPGVALSFPHKGYAYLPIRTRSPWSPPDLLRFPDGKPEMGRTLAAMVFWPPVETSLPLAWEWLLSPWEPDASGEWSRRCDANCSFRLKDCENGERRLELTPWPPPDGQAVPQNVLVAMSADYRDILGQLPPEIIRTIDLADSAARTVTIPPGAFVRLSVTGPGSVRLANARCVAPGGTP